MEMIVVTPHRPHLGEPAPVALGLAADGHLQRRIDEDAPDAWVAGSGADQPGVVWRPGNGINIHPVGAGHVAGRHFLALRLRETAGRHWRQPDIGIKPDLVRGMPGDHRPAARLRDIADQQAGPAIDRGHPPGKILQIGDQIRVAPFAVAVEPHHLPGLAIDRQRLGPCQTALGIGADGPRLQVGGRRLLPEQDFRGVGRGIGDDAGPALGLFLGIGLCMGQRRQAGCRQTEEQWCETARIRKLHAP